MTPERGTRALTPHQREQAIQRVLLLEGASDVLFLGIKLAVGLQTGSAAVLSDAIHSLTDLTNNIVGILLLRLSIAPPDREHPYGHYKYEPLAVFTVAVVITSVAIQIVIRALLRGETEVSQDRPSLIMMLLVLGVNIAFTS